MIPYTSHRVDDLDIAAVVAVLKSDRLTQGPTVPAFEAAIARELNVDADNVVACSSGTAALHLAYRALGVGPGWRVLVPAVTFTATAAAAVHCGADVVLVDVDPLTGLAGPDHFDAAMCVFPFSHGIAWVPVHLRGAVCDMAGIASAAIDCGAVVIADASHAFGEMGVGRWHVNAATFSFHPAKHVACGEGGAVVFADGVGDIDARAMRSHGMVNGTALVPGFNYRMSDIHAALGMSQLTRLHDGIAQRAAQAKRYRQLLDRRVVRHIPEAPSAHHLFVVHVEDIEDVRAHLLSHCIETQRHYRPLHHHPAYAQCAHGDLSGAEEYYRTALSLPLYPGLSVADQDRVIDAVNGRIS